MGVRRWPSFFKLFRSCRICQSILSSSRATLVEFTAFTLICTASSSQSFRHNSSTYHYSSSCSIVPYPTTLQLTQ